MKEQTYGYVRISTKEQNEARQLAALADFKIPSRNLFIDRQSGKDFDRPAYKRLMKKLKCGDLLIVQSIDRLGRNYGEILEQWRVITKEKQADIMILDMPLLNTRTQGKDLTGTFIADLVLQILSYVAQTEREFIRKRQAEGIAAAKARGVHFGVSKKPMPDGYEGAKAAWESGELSLREAAESIGVSHMTFYRRCKEDGAQAPVRSQK